MLKVKFVTGATIKEVETNLNIYLSTIDEKADIKYDLQNLLVIVEHNAKDAPKSRCCDCMFYDPSGDIRSVWGVCQRTDCRVKYMEESCNGFCGRK